MTTEAPKKPPPGCLARIVRYGVLVAVLSGVVVIVDALKVNLPIGIPGTPNRGEITGVIHVHTQASKDGGGSIDEVVSAAKWADLSFVTITDHNAALDAEIAGTDRNAVLLVGGEEVSTPDGHFLALGVTPGWRDGVAKDTQALLEAARKRKAAIFLSHPLGAAKDWTYWESDAFDGIEVWNGDAAWRDDNPFELLMAALIYTVNPDLALVRLADRPDESLAKWDELLEKRSVSGICGSDAHSRVEVAFGRSIGFPAYLRVFRLARQHVLLERSADPKKSRDQKAIIRALKQGRSFCALDGLSVASGFVNRAEGEGVVAGPGQSLTWVPGATMRVSIAPGAGRPMIKVFKDGVETFNQRGWRLDADLPGPGVYRTEVWLRQPGLTGGQQWTPWILSNPIYVTAGPIPGDEELEDEPPAPSPAPSPTGSPK